MNIPNVRIESPDGIPWKSKVTVDGVMIPCTKATWFADAATDTTRVELEVPHVGLSAEARDIVARFVAHKSSAPFFWWKCPCGMEMGHLTIEQMAVTFHDPASHVLGCEQVPATPAVLPAPDGGQ